MEDSEINQILTQNQANKMIGLKNPEELPHEKVIQTTVPVGLSLSLSVCLAMGT